MTDLLADATEKLEQLSKEIAEVEKQQGSYKAPRFGFATQAAKKSAPPIGFAVEEEELVASDDDANENIGDDV